MDRIRADRVELEPKSIIILGTRIQPKPITGSMSSGAEFDPRIWVNP